jgi:asparagine synthase (glutamine-hydrolysing)
MCGIAGLFGRGGPALAAAMGEAIRHRGPDRGDAYIEQDAGLVLAHRRLSIQDLSSAGDQPMIDASGRYVICYNGEIYNHQDLRPALEAHGHVFRGHSDTETILEAYARRGCEIFGELNGIFALAIWDRRDRTLTLARDGAGVKPLYWADTPDGLAFASEIKALLTIPSLDRTIDPVALRAYTTYLYSPGERTGLKAVRKLAPGCWMRVGQDGSRSEGRFYALPAYQPNESLTDETAIAGTRDALARAVERQMLSDVEVGAFLSGGLDSSAIVHFAKEHAKNRIQCFTISYRERPDEAGEFIPDLPYARRAAQHLGVELHEVEVSSAMADDLEALVYTLDEPQADPAALNNLYISALARRHGIKVLLGGAGGDDVFTGYRRHRAAAADHLIGVAPAWSRQAFGAVAARLPNTGTRARRLKKMASIMQGSADERLMQSIEWQNIDAADRLFKSRLVNAATEVRAPLQAVLDENKGAPAVERLLRLDQSFFLIDHNLNYTDKTGMAEGVEIRVPFLDPDLMAWAATLPLRFKLRKGETKWVLRKAMEGRLPHDVIYRPKSGFGVPLRAWLRTELRAMVESLTSREVIEARGIFDADAVAKLRQDTLSGAVDGSYPLLAIMVIELWHRRFVDSSCGTSFAAFAKAI